MRIEGNKARARMWLRAAAVALGIFLVVAGARAQRRPGRAMRLPRQERRGMGAQRQNQNHAPGFMQRLRDLPPQEQERVLANDMRFQRLPPEQQARIRENLQRWNALSPEQKQQIRERQRVLENLTPAQRREAQEVFQQWRDLPPARRRELRVAFGHLRDLPSDQREQFLTSPELQNRFSPDEIRMLRGLSRLLPEGADSPEP